MGWTPTFVGAALSLSLLLLAGLANARRGIGRWSLVPWDYLMILSAIGLIAALAQLASLWRDAA
jgi:hypothetical protein